MFEPFNSAYDADLEVALDLQAPPGLDDSADTDTVVVDVPLATGSGPSANGVAASTSAAIASTSAAAPSTSAAIAGTSAAAASSIPVTPLSVVRVTPEDVARAASDARRAAATVALAPEALDDEWFGSFDETKPVDGDDFADQPTTTWQRLSDWLWRRAA